MKPRRKPVKLSPTNTLHTHDTKNDAGEPLPLSRRQIQIYALIMQGMTNGQISRRLGISMGTVKIHVTALLRKKHVPNKIHLILQR